MTVSAPKGPKRRVAGLTRRYEPQLNSLRESDTAKAAGLAAAMVANSVLALVSTVVFARLLADYGSLAALISYFLILSVVGQAIQVATAREGVLGHLGVGPELIETIKRWTKTLVIVTIGLTVVSVLLREPIASAVGVKHDQWAAAIGLPAGCMWVELSILRGALQGVGKYKAVGYSLIGEQAVRLVTGGAAGGDRPRRHRRVPGHAAVVHRDGRVLRRSPPPVCGRASEHRGHRRRAFPGGSPCGPTSRAPGRRSRA